MTSGTSAASVLNSAWSSNNIPNENGRALMSVLSIGFGNSAGLISTNIFLAKDAPKYTQALHITAGFGAAGCAIAILILSFQVLDNRRRNRKQGVNWTYRDVPTHELQDGFFSPSFRWMY
ncbi:unnamed protein product [Ambrosiozyma monospora]|uniref:Unnamed protein product n=1 Tax=Ambrosiozyma monospora TaxID=43982 RepID=A0ACB5UB09_AMBMO|nr:unnamed protein product [Ambrosiozyma monospora]